MSITSQRFDGVADLNNGTVYVPSGGKVVYVHSSGAAALDALPEGMGANPDGFSTTINGGINGLRSNRGDRVVVLPGHSENITGATSLSNLVAGVKVTGISHGTADMPTVRWTGTAAQWAVSSAGCVFENLKLQLEGAVVAKAINVTANGVRFQRCRIQTGSTITTNVATIAIEVGSGATEFQFNDNYMYGTGGVSTNGIKFVGATVPSNFDLRRNTFIFPATEVNGLVHVTVAALDGFIEDCRFVNTVASSTAGLVLDNVATTGFAVGCDFSCLNDGTATAQGVIVGGSSVLWRFSRCFEVDEKGKNSILSPGVGT